jgi:hypothetical protein
VVPTTSSLRSLPLLLALLTPAFAQEGAQNTASAKDAAQALQVYIEGVAKSGGRPDYTKPPASDLVHRVFDLAGLAALPSPRSSDMSWLIEWGDVANRANKSIILFGLKPGPDLDQTALLRNLTEYEDQYATGMDFMIRLFAREAITVPLFMNQLTPEQRTPIREAGVQKTRRGAGELIAGAIGSIAQGMRPENARVMSAAMRDTAAIWASFLLPDDRTSIVKLLTQVSKTLNDSEARKNLATFSAALAAPI